MNSGIIDPNTGSIVLSKCVAPAFRPGFFTNCDCRYRLFKGARNTGKSHTMIGYEPILKILSSDFRNVVIARQNSNSNRQSTFPNLVARIEDLGLKPYFKVKENPDLTITYKETGQMIVFKGMNDPTTINSIAFAHGKLTDIYLEEAFEIDSYQDFMKLDGSVRDKLPPGYKLQITLLFNAWSKESWIYDKFFKGRLEDDEAALEASEDGYVDYYDPSYVGDFGKGIYLSTTTYRANPFRSPEYDESALAMKERSIDLYRVNYLGMWGNSTAATYPEFGSNLVIPFAEIKRRMDSKGLRFVSFAIGIDTGLSNGEGGRRTVGKNQQVEERIKSATAVTLVGLTSDYESIVVIDEWYHTEIERNRSLNTDGEGQIGLSEILSRVADTIVKWSRKYADANLGLFGGQTVYVYVDNADVGFTQLLSKEFDFRNIYNVRVLPSTKKVSVQARVDYEKDLMAYGNFVISSTCPNLAREFRNARRDPKGRARTDTDDHAITACEYAFSTMLPDMNRWKTFKERNI